jgi:hypothetical protein
VTFGCGPKEPTYAPGYKASFEKRVGADEGQAQAFLNTLAATPFAGRGDYVRAHPEEAKNLGKIADRSVQLRYQDLMKNPNAR